MTKLEELNLHYIVCERAIKRINEDGIQNANHSSQLKKVKDKLRNIQLQMEEIVLNKK